MKNTWTLLLLCALAWSAAAQNAPPAAGLSDDTYEICVPPVPRPRLTKFSENKTTVRIRHGLNRILDPHCTGRMLTDSVISLDMEKPDSVLVVIEDANPILYSYTIGPVKTEVTSNYTTAVNFLTPLAALTQSTEAMLANTVTQAQAQAMSRGLSVSNIDRWNAVIFNEGFRVAPPNQSAAASAIAVASDNEKAAISKTLGFDVASLDNLYNATVRITAHVKEIDLLLVKSRRTRKDGEEVKATVAAWKLADDAQTIRDSYGQLNAVQTKMRDPNIDVNKTSSDFQEIFIDVSLARDQEASVYRALDLLESFVADVPKLNQPIAISTPISYSASENQSIAITIAPVEKYAGITGKAEIRRPVATTVVFKPHESVQLALAPAMIYSLGERSDFDLKEVGSEFEVTEKFEDVRGTSVAGMLNIYPEWLNRTGIGLGLQVGVKPSKDDLGFYFGSGIRLFNRGFVGIGVAFERSEHLRAGDVVGKKFAKRDDFKPDVDYPAAIYFQVSVDLANIKGGK